MSYSQNGEDEWVLAELERSREHWLKHWPEYPPTKLVLEIGAYHPTVLSNSRLLIENGWKALLIEASPYCAANLIDEYGKNPNVQIINAAVAVAGATHRLIKMKLTRDATSTAGDPWPGTTYNGEAWVPMITVEEMLMQFGPNFDVVSIDAEGTSVELAVDYIKRVWPRPKLLIVEHATKCQCGAEATRIVEFFAQVQEFGYHIARINGENLILELCRRV